MQGKRMAFSQIPSIFSSFYETDIRTGRKKHSHWAFCRRYGYSFSKDLSILYHKHPTESTLFCNFFLQNCELVPLHIVSHGSLRPFGQNSQFDIFSRISAVTFPGSPSFPFLCLTAHQRHSLHPHPFSPAPARRRCRTQPLRLQQNRPLPAFCRSQRRFFHLFRRNMQKERVSDRP